MKRAIGAVGTFIAVGGCAAAIPLFAAILGATLGMLTAVGLYVLQAIRRSRRTGHTL